MMDFNSEEIEALILREIAGTLSPEEQQRLSQYIADNKEAHLLRQELHGRFTPELLAEIRAMIPSKEQFMQAVKKRRRQRYVSSAVTISLIAGALIVSIFRHFYPVKSLFTVQAADTIKIPPSHIQLQRADGKKYDLSVDQRPIRAGGVTLVSENNTLLPVVDHQSAAGASNNLETAQKITTYRKPEHTSAAELFTLRVPAYMDYKVVLSDSTEVHLNANSSIIFPSQFNGSNREITITGEAYINVASRAQQPFVVHLAKDKKISVLGTEFNIDNYNSNRIKLSLVTGAARLEIGDTHTDLKPGYEALAITGEQVKVQAFDKYETSGWHNGVYIFHNKTLQELSPIIQQWYNITVALDTKAAQDLRISGTLYRRDPLHVFLETVTRMNRTSSYFGKDSTLHFK